MDLLFNGIEINCNAIDPLTKIACNQLRKRKEHGFKEIDNKKLLFSMFAAVRFGLVVF